MEKKILLRNDDSKTRIIIKKNYIKKYLLNLSKQQKKIFCIVDNNLKYIFENSNHKKIVVINVKASEEIKKISNYNIICEKLLKKGIDRNSILVAIGGGTLGDLSGFIASTLLRGVEFKLIPTTLLSQVDSSIGGKNGINTNYGKNLIGSFYQPNEIIIDTNFLKTLPIRELKSGYSEIVKHALIKDVSFFNWLDRNYSKLIKLNPLILKKAISKSINIKLWYVQKDQKEKLINKNSRSMLNFGHTIGHSLEKFYNYNKRLNHGEAISIGIIVESIISNKLGYLSNNELNKIIKHFKKVDLKILDKNVGSRKVLMNIFSDKKNYNDKINIVLLKKIGDSFFYRNIERDKLKKILNKI